MKKAGLWRVLVGATLAIFGISFAGAVAQPLISTVFAEEENTGSTMAVSPMWQTIILTPGESTTKSIRVLNPATAKQNLKFSVSVGSYSQVPNDESDVKAGTTTDVESVSSYNQMMDWITLNKTSGELAPNEGEEISFTINVPENAPGGGQYASIIVRNESDKAENGGNVSIQSDTQTASVIYAEVTGDTKEEGSILENNVPGFLTAGPLETTSVVENTGNVHEEVQYKLEVFPLGSNENICSDSDESVMRIVMPESKIYHTESCEVSSIGIYKAKQTVEAFGKTSEIERMVFVCPIWLIIVIVAVVLVIIWLIVKAIRGRK